MPAFIFLVLVGLFAHSVFVPAGPIVKPEEPLPKIVVINTAGQVIDAWRQNTEGEIVVEVPVEDVVPEEIAEAEPVEVPANAGEEASDDSTSAEEEEGNSLVEEQVDEEASQEEVIEEIFEAPPIVEDPVLVIEDKSVEEIDPEPEAQNLVEALIEE